MHSLLQKNLSVVCQKKLNEKLKNRQFSILVDESTDIGNKKNMCVLARFFDDGVIKTELLDIIELNSQDCTAEALYLEFKNCLKKK